jgi:hypothetical protein
MTIVMSWLIVFFFGMILGGYMFMSIRIEALDGMKGDKRGGMSSSLAEPLPRPKWKPITGEDDPRDPSEPTRDHKNRRGLWLNETYSPNPDGRIIC